MAELFICTVSSINGNTVDVNIVEKDVIKSAVPVIMNCGMPEAGATVYGLFRMNGNSVGDGVILGEIFGGSITVNSDIDFAGQVTADNLVFDDIPLKSHRHNGDDGKPSAE